MGRVRRVVGYVLFGISVILILLCLFIEGVWFSAMISACQKGSVEAFSGVIAMALLWWIPVVLFFIPGIVLRPHIQDLR
ncbi:MAG: hypothetical protein J7L11_05815 [Thermoprotei archaeon]|nr:hypothetical protein [Thermoprotei archaeon]